jgi:Cu-Zn family superoxide dismutase
MLSLNGPNSIIGRSIIVHADPDDLKSQPSGNAGARVGCGVIGIADPKMQH